MPFQNERSDFSCGSDAPRISMPTPRQAAMRFAALFLAFVVAALPASGVAMKNAPTGARLIALHDDAVNDDAVNDEAGGGEAADRKAVPTPRRVAVVITQAIGVGALADRLGGIASAAAAKGGAAVLDPAASSRQLRIAHGPDPLTCGSETKCLEAIGAALDVRWVLALGIGRFGGMYGLDLRLVDRKSDAAPASTSGTWAEPGPDWEVALGEALAALLPAELQAPPRGTLLVRANEPGELFVDGESAGSLPLEKPVELAVGSHHLELRGESGRAHATAEIRADELAEVEMTLAPAIATASSGWMRTGSYVAGGSAVALLTAAIITNLSASSTMDDARAQKKAGEPFAGSRNDALDTIDTSRVLYGAAAVVAAGAVMLFLLDEPAAAPTVPAAP